MSLFKKNTARQDVVAATGSEQPAVQQNASPAPAPAPPTAPGAGNPAFGGAVARAGAEGVAKGVGTAVGKSLWQKAMELIGAADEA